MAKQKTLTAVSSLLAKLEKEREHHLASLEEIDAIFRRFGASPGPGAGRRRGGRAMGGARRGGRGAGSRVQGVKDALLSSLSGSPQSPADLAAKVSKRLGTKVNIATQLHMLKRDKKAKSVGRGQWVRG
jgi:hypothetical protein